LLKMASGSPTKNPLFPGKIIAKILNNKDIKWYLE
jgi:hypothetical protein